VVNYDVPEDAESYVHRIGRTARAGKAGKAITLACERFVYGLYAIEKYLGSKIPVMPFDESLLLADRSSGLRFSRDRGGEGRSRDSRQGARGFGSGRSGAYAGGRPSTGRPGRLAEVLPIRTNADRLATRRGSLPAMTSGGPWAAKDSARASDKDPRRMARGPRSGKEMRCRDRVPHPFDKARPRDRANSAMERRGLKARYPRFRALSARLRKPRKPRRRLGFSAR